MNFIKISAFALLLLGAAASFLFSRPKDLALRVTGADNNEKRFYLPARPLKKPLTIGGVRVDEVLPHALVTRRVEENPATPPNHAVEAEISSERLGIHQTMVLIERDPFDPLSFSAQIGPAVFRLKTPALSAKKHRAVLRMYEPPNGAALETPAGHGPPAFVFSVSPEGAWSYQSSTGAVDEASPLSEGDEIETGWADMKLRVKKIYRHAKVSREVAADPENRSETAAFRIAGQWLLSGRSLTLSDGVRVEAAPSARAVE